MRSTIPGLITILSLSLAACSGPHPCDVDADCQSPQRCIAGGCRNAESHPAGTGASLIRDEEAMLSATWTPEGGISLQRSIDGIEWRPVSTPVGPPARSPVLGRTHGGKVLLAWSAATEATPGEDPAGLPTRSDLYIAISTDDGHTFDEPRRLPLGEYSHGAPHGRMVVLSDDTVLLFADLWYTSDDPLPADKRGNVAAVLRSADGGGYWSGPERIAAQHREPAGAWLADDHLLTLLRNERGDITLSASFDRGHVWSEPAFYASADPRPADLIAQFDGTLLLAFSAACGTDGPQLTVLRSDDGTGFGLPRRRLLGPAPATAGLGAVGVPLPGGQAMVFTDLTRGGAHTFSFESLPEARCAELGRDKQLLLDDELIAASDGVSLHVHAPEKTGEILIRSESPWDDFITGEYPCPIQDGGKVRLWYEVYDHDYPIKADFGARLCYAESSGGGPFLRPSLGLVDYHGSKDNNIVFPVDPDAPIFASATVFLDPHDGPEGRYKMVHQGENGLRIAVSPDGLRWTQYPAAILGYSSDTQNVVYWDDELRRYVGFFRGRDDQVVRNVTRSESADLRHFFTPVTVMRRDAHDPPNSDLYNSAATKYPWAAHAYLTFPSLYNHVSDTLDVELAVSRDGTHYTRFREPRWIANGPPGSFDSAAIYQGPGLIREGNTLYVYYNAFDLNHNDLSAMKAGVISRAALRLDGFRSADAAQTGTLTTIPVTFTGGHLRVNATGKVRAALLEADGAAIAGFGLQDCAPVEGDNYDAEITWVGGKTDSLAGRWITVRFELTGASLYSFGFAAQ